MASRATYGESLKEAGLFVLFAAAGTFSLHKTLDAIDSAKDIDIPRTPP